MSWLDIFSAVLTVVVAFTNLELLVLVPMITSALKALGIDESKEATEMGDRMLQAEEQGITPDNFETYDEYIKAIDNFELNPEKSQQFSEKEKLEKYSATHLTELTKNYGDGALTFLTEIALKQDKSFNMSGKIKEYMDTFGKNIDNVNGYFKGELSLKDMEKVETQIIDLEKKLTPEKSEMDILNELSNGRDNVKL